MTHTHTHKNERINKQIKKQTNKNKIILYKQQTFKNNLPLILTLYSLQNFYYISTIFLFLKNILLQIHKILQKKKTTNI